MSELLSLLLPVSAEQPIRWQCVALEPASGALAQTPISKVSLAMLNSRV
ncbi:hypothetical protein PCI56_11735 [Plesiomonas shigelloides subsp. oncorhynchi]|nr:hypothetical protein [Plesiomonas shigelloides]